jgi:TolB-like protein
MSHVFISYARATAKQAQQMAEALKALGYSVWIDDQLPAHRHYAHVIEEQLNQAKAVLVLWSAEAAKSDWVMDEAERGREQRKLVQVSLDKSRLPMPFGRIQCTDLAGWAGETDAAGWRKVITSIGDLVGGSGAEPAAIAGAAVADAPLPLPSKPSIAVMPFVNLSGDPEQDYFADGMVAEIVTALSHFKSIFVIGSGSTLSFKGQAVSPEEVGRRLGVRYVLEGSIRKAAGRVRISVNLSDAADGSHVMADRFEDTLEDIFALQDKVALTIAGKMEPTIEVAEGRRTSSRAKESLGSYELYLRAWALERTAARPNVFEALELLNRAIDLDPNFAPALALAAICYRVIYNLRWTDDPEATRRQGSEFAHRALKMGADDANVLANVASVLVFFDRDLDGAIALLDRAMKLNPGSASVWFYSGIRRLQAGLTELAVEQLETALRLDPIGPSRPHMIGFLGQARFQQRRFSEAIPLLRELVRDTDSPRGYAFLAATYGHLGDVEAAAAALTRFHALSSQPVKEFARADITGKDDLKLFMEGLALAAGVPPPT